MQKYFLMFCLIITLSSCLKPQNEEMEVQLLGGPCEGCEAVFEYGNKNLMPSDTLPGFYEEGDKLKITGTIYKNDGTTPAGDVILYVYHTDQNGIYAKKGDETGWGKRHGYMRGWIKTDSNGKYEFYTIKPASYPNGSTSAHIHTIILEPNGSYYWIADYFFEDDPLLNERERNPESPRGGSGVMKLVPDREYLTGKRDIILGKNIRGYQ